MTQAIPFKIFYKGTGRLLYVDNGIDWNGMANKIILLFPEAGNSAEDIQLFYKDNDGKPMVFDTSDELNKIIQRISEGEEQLQFLVWNKNHKHKHHHSHYSHHHSHHLNPNHYVHGFPCQLIPGSSHHYNHGHHYHHGHHNCHNGLGTTLFYDYEDNKQHNEITTNSEQDDSNVSDNDNTMNCENKHNTSNKDDHDLESWDKDIWMQETCNDNSLPCRPSLPLFTGHHHHHHHHPFHGHGRGGHHHHYRHHQHGPCTRPYQQGHHHHQHHHGAPHEHANGFMNCNREAAIHMFGPFNHRHGHFPHRGGFGMHIGRGGFGHC
ncbi:hypothetical protein BDF22DRAFT_772780 [Syncephalis plumigaleata]|nr:hypothetical protein BDF22DRAFT_772780 [Syncephalis plumigaleata]